MGGGGGVGGHGHCNEYLSNTNWTWSVFLHRVGVGWSGHERNGERV